MSESDNRFLMSLPEKLVNYVDETIEVINAQKRPASSKANRQSLIRAVLEYCKRKNLQFSSGYSRHVYVKDEEPSD